jgi:AbrB family looped-hinge helix DNA binding protein
VRITSKGRVTIPRRIRERAGLLPHAEVEFEMVRGRVVLKPLGGRARRYREYFPRLKVPSPGRE